MKRLYGNLKGISINIIASIYWFSAGKVCRIILKQQVVAQYMKNGNIWEIQLPFLVEFPEVRTIR